MKFPESRPDSPASASALWSLQQLLLRDAERALGSRDQSKTIYQPVFREGGPRLRNTPDEDGAFSELSLNAAGYWPTVVYELAHETIHLLNPVTGLATWMEEGVAVEFSVRMSKSLTDHPMAPEDGSRYSAARWLIHHFPDPVFSSIAGLRRDGRSLSSVTEERILTVFPMIEPSVARLLASPCKPR